MLRLTSQTKSLSESKKIYVDVTKSIERLYSTQSVAVEFGEEIEEPIDVENELSTILSVPFLPYPKVSMKSFIS